MEFRSSFFPQTDTVITPVQLPPCPRELEADIKDSNTANISVGEKQEKLKPPHLDNENKRQDDNQKPNSLPLNQAAMDLSGCNTKLCGTFNVRGFFFIF